MPHNWDDLGVGKVCKNCGWQAGSDLRGVPDECNPEPARLPPPLRTDEQIAAILEICSTCEQYRPNSDVPCKLCRTCRESKEHFKSQLKWAHKHCPAKPPKW